MKGWCVTMINWFIQRDDTRHESAHLCFIGLTAMYPSKIGLRYFWEGLSHTNIYPPPTHTQNKTVSGLRILIYSKVCDAASASAPILLSSSNETRFSCFDLTKCEPPKCVWYVFRGLGTARAAAGWQTLYVVVLGGSWVISVHLVEHRTTL